MNFADKKKRSIGIYTESITYYFISRKLKEKKKKEFGTKIKMTQMSYLSVHIAIFYTNSELIKIYIRSLSFSTKLKNMLFPLYYYSGMCEDK